MERKGIDLHIHTSASDGTDSPLEIISRVREAGIGLFSVTDHDTLKCGVIIPALLKAGDPRFICGVEFSCRDGSGKYHVLGYGFDPGSPAIKNVAELGHRLRMEKTEARLEFIKTRFGFGFPEEEISALLALDNPGKPHIANLMVKYGYAETKDAAIRRYIDLMHLDDHNIRPEQAIRGISDAGGVPVLAHPAFGDGDQLIAADEMEERVRRLVKMGLGGMECFYSGFDAALRGEMLSLAERFGLYVTCGSDYHGGNKPVAPGDTGLDAESEYPAGLKRFLEDMKSHEFAAI